MSLNRRLLMGSRISFSLVWGMLTLPIARPLALIGTPLLFDVIIGGTRYPVGAIMFLPLIAGTATLIGWLRAGPPDGWRFGRPAMTVPVLAYGSLTLIRSWPIHDSTVLAETVVGVLILWGVYVYTVQNWPARWLVRTMGVVAIVHGVVAAMQFVTQGPVGLAFFGEQALEPQIRGASVIEVAGRRWLRAYGLTAHPNLLGGLQATALLAFLGRLLPNTLPGMDQRQPAMEGRTPGWLWGAVVMAVVGLVLSFSRSAWLGTALATLYFAGVTRLRKRVRWRTSQTRWILAGVGILAAVAAIVLGPLVVARLGHAGSILERNSVQERIRDIGQAWMLMRNVPLTGVGSGYYTGALWAWANATGQDYPAFQLVHNVPLLAGAELGVPGMALWFWIVSVPAVSVALTARKGPVRAEVAARGAVFVLLWVVGMFDCYPYPRQFWSASLIGAFCGVWARTPSELGT